MNLYVTYPPADFLDYVNPPIGKGMPVPGPLKPLIAIPTTAGTGSETTGVTIFDLISHARQDRNREPAAEADARAARSRKHAHDAVASGRFERARYPEPRHRVVHRAALHRTSLPDRPLVRPAYQGSNPISDVWSLQALRMVAKYIVRAVEDPSDDEARANMLLAASYAGVGFGNCRRASAARNVVSGFRQREELSRSGYAADHALVPHGFSVILNSPAVFRFTASANPARHLEAAEALGVDVARCQAADAGRILSERITWFMQRLKTPNGLREIGYTSSDIPALVEGTLPQHRVTKLSPRPAGPEELSTLFESAMVAW